MEPGTHYLAKLELIIMFHGALRKFRSIVWTSTMRNEGEKLNLEKRTLHTIARAIPKKCTIYISIPQFLISFNYIFYSCKRFLKIAKYI